MKETFLYLIVVTCCVFSHVVDVWQREGKWLDSEQPYAIGLRFGYEF